MIKYIKNADTETQTWVGQEVAPGQYYQIQAIEELEWANNSQLLTDICNNIAIVARTNDGSDDILDVASAINFLKDIPVLGTDGVPLIRVKSFSDADGFRFRGKGISSTVPKTSTVNVDYKLTEERYINGVDLILKDQEFGDTAKFQVVDKEYIYAGILYPTDYGGIPWSTAQPDGVVLDEFGTDWNIVADEQHQHPVLLSYPARILINLYIRIVYTSVGTVNDVKLKANLFLHKKL